MIEVILGELRAVEVVKSTSVGSSKCMVDQNAQKTLSITFHVERAFK